MEACIHPLSKAPLIDTESLSQGRGLYAWEQAGERTPRPKEIEVAEKMIPVWDNLKGLFLGYARNGFNKLSRLVMI